MLYLGWAETCQFGTILTISKLLLLKGWKQISPNLQALYWSCHFSFFLLPLSFFFSTTLKKYKKSFLACRPYKTNHGLWFSYSWSRKMVLKVFLLNVTDAVANLRGINHIYSFSVISEHWCGYLSVIVYCLDLTLLYIHNSRFSHV